MKAVRLGRKTGAATSTLPSLVGSLVAVARFQPPMRRHVACSGCP
jgi:hypothetical protein